MRAQRHAQAGASVVEGQLHAVTQGHGTHQTEAEAFRRSMVKLAADPTDPSLAHPGAWAPFVVVGENR